MTKHSGPIGVQIDHGMIFTMRTQLLVIDHDFQTPQFYHSALYCLPALPGEQSVELGADRDLPGVRGGAQRDTAQTW